ncbi:MAG: glycosyltransferase family 4 protein [Minwuia sp.]|uniref:glycosyltransferase family 4 protein n=1 Tax=Minwuia sp. TaxID=2493630 RepID=UPI003A8BA5AC
MTAERRKTVLVLGSYAPSLLNFRGPMIREMVGRGHRVLALAPDFDAVTQAGVSELGAEPVHMPMDRGGVSPLGDLSLLCRLVRIFRQRRPDVVFAYTMKPVCWGGLAARLAGVPVFAAMVTGLGYGFARPTGALHAAVARALRFLLRRALAEAKVVFLQNRDDRADLEAAGVLQRDANVVMVAGSGIDLDRFPQRPVPDAPQFLMIARLLGAKGVREYAAASLRLMKQDPSVGCDLVGWIDASADAVSEAEADAWVAEGLGWHGFQEDVRPFLERTSVYVLPSYREGTPRSVLEAMATGRAVITTDAPGCRETVEDGENGFLVPVADAEALYRAMVRYVEDPALRESHGQRGRELAETRFDVRRVNQAVLDALGL